MVYPQLQNWPSGFRGNRGWTIPPQKIQLDDFRELKPPWLGHGDVPYIFPPYISRCFPMFFYIFPYVSLCFHMFPDVSICFSIYFPMFFPWFLEISQPPQGGHPTSVACTRPWVGQTSLSLAPDEAIHGGSQCDRGFIRYHGLSWFLSWFTMVYHGFYHGLSWFTMVLPWFAMVYHGLSWFIMVCHGLSWFLSWFIMVYNGFYHGLSWFTMVLPWFAMVYHGLSWFIMVYHGLSWFIMVYHGLSWFIMFYHIIYHTYMPISNNMNQ